MYTMDMDIDRNRTRPVRSSVVHATGLLFLGRTMETTPIYDKPFLKHTKSRLNG